MEKILRFFGKEYHNVSQAAFLLGIFSLLSQILGLFRDRAIAHFIGPSPLLDAYYAAFRVPDLIFISVASLASVTVLIPFMSEKEGVMTSGYIRTFLSNVFSVFSVTLIFVALLFYILMPYIVHIVAPGFSTVMQLETINLSRIMLLSPIFLGLSNLFGSITQLHRKFFVYSLSPIFYNAGIIGGIVLLYPHIGISGLAIGVVLGACMHFAVQASAATQLGFAPRFTLHIDWSVIRKVVSASLPRTLGLSFNNIALISIVSFASFLSSGSISIFNLSLNLQSVPLGIIGLSYAVAAFPTLSKAHAQGLVGNFKRELKQAANQIIFWSLPVAFLFIVLRAQIVRVILGSGFFSWDDTRLVAASLAVFSLS
ncbi:MAG: lipid II flippase MurJ, partial [Candidatus Paceibacterota bacterium]